MKWNRLASMLLSLVLLLLFIPISVQAANEEEIRFLIEHYYYKELDQEILNQESVEDIMRSLDPYSTYFTAEEYEAMLNSVNLNYTGIGIIVEAAEKGITVLQVFDKSPAQQAGLKVGDLLLEVEGTPLGNLSLEEATALIKGKKGTYVQLRVLRPTTNEIIELKVERREIQLPTVEYGLLGGDVGYIRLLSFSEDAAEAIEEALLDLEDEATSWIFDLRDNGGGFLNAATEVVGFFPNIRDALMMEGNNHEKVVFQAIPQQVQFEKPTALLINSYSASASEIIAGAVKDHQAATLYGQTTFGKGLAQSLFELSDDSVLKLSVASFYTPKGHTIHSVGIAPDVETAPGEELIRAHRDLLIKGRTELANYQTLSRRPSFTIQTSTAMTAANVKELITLVQLGGGSVDIEVFPLAYDSFVIKPKDILNANSHYLLLANADEQSHYVEFTTGESVETAAIDHPFADVDTEAFFAGPTYLLHELGIIEGIGEGQFAPYSYLKRQDVAVMFARALGVANNKAKDPGFLDVNENTYYYNAIAALKELGIMQGKTDKQFGVDEVLTREQMAGLLSRAFNLVNSNDKVPFTDIRDSFFYEDIKKVYQAGITKGNTPTTFAPHRAVTRGEFATFLYRALVNERQGELTNITIEAIR